MPDSGADDLGEVVRMGDLQDPLDSPGTRSECRVAGLDRLLVRFLLAIIVLFVAKQMITAIIFPPFTGHDEVAHLSYAWILVDEQRVPEFPVDADDRTWDEIPDYFYQYCQYILDWAPCQPENPRWLDQPFRLADWGARGVHPVGELYVANHPPAYYLYVAPVLRGIRGTSPETQQYVLRILAIPLGVLVVLFTYLSARIVFPRDAFVPIVATALVAFQPQISYEAAMVNNDIAAIAAMSAILYLLLRGNREGFPLLICVLTGLAFGIALITKGNLAIAVPVIALAVILSTGLWNMRAWLGRGAVIGAVGAVISAPWYVFLQWKYGSLTAAEQVKLIQRPWNNPAGDFGELLWNRDFVWNRWRETWGAFGWRRIQLSDWLLWIIAVPIILAFAGLVIYLALSIRERRRIGRDPALPGFEPANSMQLRAMVIMIAAVVIAYLAIIEFGTDFALTQARYYFPVVGAAAIPLATGARTLIPRPGRPISMALILSGLVLVTVIIYTKYVVPYWHLTEW